MDTYRTYEMVKGRQPQELYELTSKYYYIIIIIIILLLGPGVA